MVPPASQRMLDVRIGRQAQMRGTLGREQGCVNIVGTIRPVEARELAAEAESYDAGLPLVHSMVPEGWQLLSVTTSV